MNTTNIQQESLQEILSYLKDGIAYTSEQAPLVVGELIAWLTYKSVGLVLVGVLIVTICKCLSTKAEEIEDEADAKLVQGIAFIVTLGVGVPMILINTFCLVKLLVAPKVVLIEHITELLQ